ncbi:hypothetical protein [Archangium violaceum]|uniref:hypothetical protein n=1 Tax=Archangium violaceum TaxID=83451 RepID=UPI00126993DE|nr:hypothetical protein [Archangium violaceum]
MNRLQLTQAVLLCSLLLAAPGRAGGPAPTTPEAPAQVAAIEYGPQGARPVVIQVSTRRVQWTGDWRQDAAVAHLSWSPDGTFLLYRQADTLMRHTLGEQGSIKLAEGLAMPRTRPDYELRPDGQQVALRRAPSQVAFIPVGTAAGISQQVDMPSGCLPSSMQWQPDGKVLHVLCAQESSKTAPLLVKLDPAAGVVTFRPAPDVAELLGWSEQRGLLVSGKADAYGQRPGNVKEDGSYHPLRPAPALPENSEESPPIDFVQGYLPSIDGFVMARATEDPHDPVVLTLVTPGESPAKRWLKSFKRVGTISYGVPGPWVAFVDRKPADRADVGDIYIVRAGKEDARLVIRANAKRDTFYGGPEPRPHKAGTSAPKGAGSSKKP